MQLLTLWAGFALAIATPALAQAPSPFATTKCEADVVTFNNVRVPQAVVADGKPLAAGIYQLRITADRPTPAAGQSPTAACWVEFVTRGEVAGREVASVVSAQEIAAVAKGPEPKVNAARVDLLKGGDYLRVWANSHGTHYIINLPVAR